MENKSNIINVLKDDILVLDGAMGTMIQREKLNESDFRGQIFKKKKKNLKGNNDLLNLSKEKLIYEIHMQYLENGADIIETNTFNSTYISSAIFAISAAWFLIRLGAPDTSINASPIVLIFSILYLSNKSSNLLNKIFNL